MASILAIFTFFLFSYFTEASLSVNSGIYFEKEGESLSNIWDPKKDAIYDPETGLCHLEDKPEKSFLPSELYSILEAMKTSYPISETSPEASTSPVFLEISPRPAFTPVQTKSFIKSSRLHVPEKCRNYERKWDFFMGNPEDDVKAIGWVSRIGYADDFIKDLNLPIHNASYTLLPHGYYTKNDIWKQIYSSKYLEIFCHKWDLFHILFAISGKVDNFLRKVIFAIKITCDADENISIKIFINPKKEMGLWESVYDQLMTLYPHIIYYQAY